MVEFKANIQILSQLNIPKQKKMFMMRSKKSNKPTNSAEKK